MTNVGAGLPPTPLSQVHSADISSFGSEISRKKNECLTWFFKNHVHTHVFQKNRYQELFSPLLLPKFTCTTHGISIPSTTCKHKNILGQAAVLFLHLKQHMATKKKHKLLGLEEIPNPRRQNKEQPTA